MTTSSAMPGYPGEKLVRVYGFCWITVVTDEERSKAARRRAQLWMDTHPICILLNILVYPLGVILLLLTRFRLPICNDET